MSIIDLNRYYFRMINRFLDQANVPKQKRKEIINEVHQGLKAAYNYEFGEELEIKSISKESKIKRSDLWFYVSKCEAILIRDYGYFVEDNEELKFE